MIRLNMKIIQNERVNIMTDRELLELIATKVANLTNQMDKLTVDVSEVKDEAKKQTPKQTMKLYRKLPLYLMVINKILINQIELKKKYLNIKKKYLEE